MKCVIQQRMHVYVTDSIITETKSKFITERSGYKAKLLVILTV